ncbi:MAG: rhomboid family intramembrane serine protease, partial [Candidatus Xenobia bacterium]
MLPLGDAVRRPLHFPAVTALLIAANAAVFLWELTSDNATILSWTLIPAHVAQGQDLWTIISAMFMHGGWEHILG